MHRQNKGWTLILSMRRYIFVDSSRFILTLTPQGSWYLSPPTKSVSCYVHWNGSFLVLNCVTLIIQSTTHNQTTQKILINFGFKRYFVIQNNFLRQSFTKILKELSGPLLKPVGLIRRIYRFNCNLIISLIRSPISRVGSYKRDQWPITVLKKQKKS